MRFNNREFVFQGTLSGLSVADVSTDRDGIHSRLLSESYCEFPIRITGDVSHPFVLPYRAFPISCFRVPRVNSPARRRHRRRRTMAYNGSRAQRTRLG